MRKLGTSFLLLGLFFLCQPFFIHSTSGTFIFPGVAGPQKHSSLPFENPFTVEHYANGSPAHLAVLLTNSQSSWMELMRGLRAIGIPSYLVPYSSQRLEELTQTSRVIMIYPSLDANFFSPSDLNLLENYVASGGSLIGINPLNALANVFGYHATVASTTHTELLLNRNNPLLSSFYFSEDLKLPLTNGTDKKIIFKSNDFLHVTANIIATYEDRTPAIIENNYQEGRAVGFSFDLGNFFALSYTQKFSLLKEDRYNFYMPVIDNLLRIIRQIYVLDQPDAVLINSVPNNKSLAMLITHEISDQASLTGALNYAKFEAQQGISATYFVAPKYFKDNTEASFYNYQAVKILHKIYGMGMEIGSASLSNRTNFASFTLGLGTEQYPTYESNQTLFGELRVSKFLLDSTIQDLAVLSHRSGSATTPGNYSQVLKAVKYRFCSSLKANTLRSHFAYQKNYGDALGISTDIYEFPITIDDSKYNIIGFLPQSVTLANQLSLYGGCLVLSIQPDNPTKKLDFEKQLVAAVEPYAWFGSISQFGKWWYARDELELHISTVENSTKKLLKVSSALPIQNLTLTIPANWSLDSTYPASIIQAGNTITLPFLHGELELLFDF